MEPHRRAEPEPVEIVLVPIDATAEPVDASAGLRRPAPAGAGTMPAIGQLVVTAVGRIAAVDDPPLVRDRHQREPWSDQRVHRLVRLPPWDAVGALRDVVQAHHGTIVAPARPRRAAHRPRPRSGTAHLVVEPTAPPGGPLRLRGALHLHARGRATPVELTLEPWSVHRTDLCLQPRRGRFGVHLPRRYYDVAHRVMDELWQLIERAAAT